MSGENDRDRLLIDLGNEILAAMGAISEAAGEALSSPSEDASRSALAIPSNMMVGEAKPERFLSARNAEVRADLAAAASRGPSRSSRLARAHMGDN